MRSRPWALVAATVAVGGAALVATAALDGRSLNASVPVPSTNAAPVILPGSSICERAFRVPMAVNGAQLPLVTGGDPGPPLRVVLREPSGRPLASEWIAGGYRASGYRELPVTTARFATIAAGRRIKICLANHGTRAVALYAGKSQRSRHSHGIALVALSERPKSLLSELPTVFERAALFHLGAVGPWTFWLLFAGLLVAVPGLLAFAVHAAAWSGGEAN